MGIPTLEDGLFVVNLLISDPSKLRLGIDHGSGPGRIR